MVATIQKSDHLTLHPPSQYQFDDDYFFALCQANRDLRLERDADGNIILMPPTGSETGRYNSEMSADVVIWNRKKQTGYVFDSSTGFTLSNSAIRSPDVSWIQKNRWNQLPEAKREKFAPICPDFVIEIRSKKDSIRELKAKMEEYRENGCRLGWLIDRIDKTVTIYRENGSIEIRTGERLTLSGEAVLEGFEMEVIL
ncbi:Uma2 family endonuclease [Larkinella terrae]|uniref:Uma2 family endonuclease n=1 Tax=Larkinella terrae TaxID=2025311 RepID=A0A7K0ES92_9BACT|nr:Uma2 family endonuclease [Larkinella terrae]MRS64684.1 Uma2 family endonuclease [Larkinella terrae]